LRGCNVGSLRRATFPAGLDAPATDPRMSRARTRLIQCHAASVTTVRGD
jgi:hypothetical protein